MGRLLMISDDMPSNNCFSKKYKSPVLKTKNQAFYIESFIVSIVPMACP